ncbi:MAG: sensor histidine kinase [Saprospiraceae bacterium]
MLLFGISLVQENIFTADFDWTRIFHRYLFSQALYVLVTLELTNRLFKRYYPQKKILELTFGILGLIVFFILFRYFLEEWLYKLIFGKGNYINATFTYYFRDNILYAINYITLGFLVFLFDNNWQIQQRLWELQVRNKDAELKFLKSQVNPHFLFNTLNNVYTLVYEKSDKAPEAYLKMTELTRYMLYEKEDLVPITEEIDHLKNYINLQQLRFEKEIALDLIFELGKDIPLIPPYTLITLAENIFKHGEVSDFKNKAIISIKESDNQLTINTANKIKKQLKDEQGGVGLANIRTRIALLFPNKHTFKTKIEGDLFHLEIRLNLQD